MDICEWGKKFNYGADYYDMATGYIYKCTEYRQQLLNGDTDAKIRVVDENDNTVGYAEK